MYCKICGKNIDNDSLFCNHCGIRQYDSIENETSKNEINAIHNLSPDHTFNTQSNDNVIKEKSIFETESTNPKNILQIKSWFLKFCVFFLLPVNIINGGSKLLLELNFLQTNVWVLICLEIVSYILLIAISIALFKVMKLSFVICLTQLFLNTIICLYVLNFNITPIWPITYVLIAIELFRKRKYFVN